MINRMSKLPRAQAEGHRKSNTPAKIAAWFAELVAETKGAKWKPRTPRAPKFAKQPSAGMLAVKNGRVWIDTAQWPQIRPRSEERRVGKECRSRWSPYH